MPELNDGDTIEIQGSASKPYQIKFLAGIYSCTCPAWRYQSVPIDRRTCKHIRQIRGNSANVAPLGTALPYRPRSVTAPKVPPLLLAESWDGTLDPTGWHSSEKLDGTRAYWDGKQFLSRMGNRFYAPDWFTAGLPLEPLDGELWIGRKQFQRTVSIVRRQDGGDHWKEIRFLVFDAPAHDGPFEKRMELVKLIMTINRPVCAQAHVHELCRGVGHLEEMLAQVEAQGGEGLMLRQPGSAYTAGRSGTLLKIKTFHDAEARVVGHEPGAGRHRGRLGALLVALANGTRFAVGTGLSDRERTNPPPIGSTITFKYQELTDAGVPRFPTYVGIRYDPELSSQQGESMSIQTARKRRFEFVEGTSSKFWEIETLGNVVHVQFGRIGAAGQTVSKSFADEASAAKHADTITREKLAKGYIEVAA